jgi:hypothetical protein
MSFPALLYGIETWVKKNRIVSTIQVAEMKLKICKEYMRLHTIRKKDVRKDIYLMNERRDEDREK